MKLAALRLYLSGFTCLVRLGFFFQFGFLHTIISSLSYNTWPLGVNSTYGCNLFSWKVKFKFTCQSGFQTIYFVRIELQKKKYVHFLCCTEWNQYVLAKDTKLHEKFTRTFSPTLRLIRWWIKGNVDQNVRSRWIFIIEQIKLFYLYKPF